MQDVLSDLLHWMEALSPVWAYVIIFWIAYGENVVPPIPGDMIVVFGGYLVGVGKLSFVVVVLLSTLGGALGFMTMYAIGYRIGEAVLDPERLRWFPKEQIGSAQRWLHRWGYGVVLANRFLSGLRSVISLTVGMARMNALRTAFFATLSALIWTGLITYAGYAVGENWQVVSEYLKRYGQVMLALLAVVGVVLAVRWYLRRRRG